MKTSAIIQARMSSSRLPGKVLLPLDGKPALERVISRLRDAKTLDDIIVATTINPADEPIVALCMAIGCKVYRGSEEDVLTRVLDAANYYEVDTIVEITADCPLIDYHHVDHLVSLFNASGYDHVSNIITRSFPRGYDVRVFSREALERTNQEVDNHVDRQHVSTWMYLNPKGKENFKCRNWYAPIDQYRPDIEVTLDTPEDYELLNWLFGFAGRGYNLELTCQQVIELIDTYPGMYGKVKRIQRKDYFEELQQAYVDQGIEPPLTEEKKEKSKRPKPLKQIFQRSEKKKDEKVQGVDSGFRRTRGSR